MISPEALKRYVFFGRLDSVQLKALAMIANEETYPAGAVVFEERTPANHLYLLMDGGIDLSYKSAEEYHPKSSKVFAVGEVNPEEVFGVSAVIEPYIYSATAMTSQAVRVIVIDAEALRQLIQNDPGFGFAMMSQIARVVYERLAYTRVQLAAAWA